MIAYFMRRINSGLVALAAAGSVLAGVSAFPSSVKAGMSSSVTFSSSVADYNPAMPGNELRANYNLSNTTSGGIPGDDVISRFALSAGSNRGIYSAYAPTGWSYNILPSETDFWANNFSLSALDIEQSADFGVYADSNHSLLTSGTISPYNDILSASFPTLETQVPAQSQVPEPSSLAILALGSATLLRRRK